MKIQGAYCHYLPIFLGSCCAYVSCMTFAFILTYEGLAFHIFIDWIAFAYRIWLVGGESWKPESPLWQKLLKKHRKMSRVVPCARGMDPLQYHGWCTITMGMIQTAYFLGFVLVYAWEYSVRYEGVDAHTRNTTLCWMEEPFMHRFVFLGRLPYSDPYRERRCNMDIVRANSISGGDIDAVDISGRLTPIIALLVGLAMDFVQDVVGHVVISEKLVHCMYTRHLTGGSWYKVALMALTPFPLFMISGMGIEFSRAQGGQL